MTDHCSIEVRGLTCRFELGKAGGRGRRYLTAVDSVDLKVQQGAVLGLVGESGCGKSTLARTIMGLSPPTYGDVLVEGRSLSDLDRRERARLIQLVPQDPFSSLNPRRRIKDNIALPLVAQGATRQKETSELVADMMARVGLRPDIGERYPAELSGGQRQRVALARALVLQPRILVCDEPTSALDVSVQAQLLNMLKKLRDDLNITLVFISHNLAVVEHIATAVAVMYLGRVVEYGPSAELFRDPQHPYTRALLASVLTPDPTLGIPDTGLGDSMPDPSNPPSGCRFNPRCRYAEPVCRSTEPPRLTADRPAECHFLGALPPIIEQVQKRG